MGDFLTWFLVFGGIFTVWCCLANYDWYFAWAGGSLLVVAALGRKVARALFMIIGIAMLSWGVYRVVNPPPKIPTDFIYQVAAPEGIQLTEWKEAVKPLGASGKVKSLKTDEKGWSSFWWQLDPSASYFEDAALSAVAGPDFDEGFHRREVDVEGATVQGRILYFNKDLASCSNALFAKIPLSAAEFVVVICDPEASRKNGFGESLGIFFCRVGTEHFETVNE